MPKPKSNWEAFITGVRINKDRLPDPLVFPFTVPAVGQFQGIRLDQPLTILAGENGSGKSTIMESLAHLAGFGSAGGTKGHLVETGIDDLKLADVASLIRSPMGREKDGYFLRAETFFQVSRNISQAYPGAYGGDLMSKSHGESIMALFKHRFGSASKALFLLDEPEAALSPARQLEFMLRIQKLIASQCQFIIATHSPILMSYPGARIYWLSESGIEERRLELTDHYSITLAVLKNRARYFKELGLEDG